MRKLLILLAALMAIPMSARADFTGKDAASATITFKNPNTCTSVVCVPIFALYDTTGVNGVAVTTAGADGASNTANGLLTYARNVVWNGTTWDRWAGGQAIDQAAWTQGTSLATPHGGVFLDTATLASGTQGTVRLTTKRAQIMDVDAAGSQLHTDLTSPPNLTINGSSVPWTGLTPPTAQTGTIVAANTDQTSMGGIAYGAMANYGTSPGAVKVPG